MLQTTISRDGWRPATATGLRDRTGGLRLPYVAAHYGKSLLWCASESMFAFLLTELAHLPPMAVGWVLALSFLLSGALDIAVGTAFRRQLSTIAACSRLQLTGAITAAAALLLLFSVPALHPAMPLLLAASAILLFRLAYAFVDLPQNAMLSLLVQSDARMSLASLRLVASGLAALTIGAWASAIVYSPASHRSLLLILTALPLAAITIGSSAHLRRRVLASPGAKTPPIAKPFAVAGRLPVAVWRLVGVMLVINFAAPVFTRMLPYYAAYQIHDPLLGSSAIAFVSLGALAGPPIWYGLLRARSAEIHIVACALSLAAAAGLFGLAGWTGGPALVVIAGLLGLGAGGPGMAIWSAFGQIVADAGRGREGLAYGLFTAAAKVALALDAIGMGWLMSDPTFREPSSPRLLLYMTLPSIIAGVTAALLVLVWRPGGRGAGGPTS
ncbi:MFS transporter [Sphingomonas sp. 10B4]|uniref:MFS transporter n=1 Tax=Sphingomonas sp. 10B4 TaxID=3048575 RepID=UPI002AB54C28|nr:MFS transporter [Sphingomonas sp. 10B4]MDY7524575.1 MFS transporter [Sphingomonas sp. 10B4]MEB0283993.1 MFS transporter [Sphingomonas sp. 10B4]